MRDTYWSLRGLTSDLDLGEKQSETDHDHWDHHLEYGRPNVSPVGVELDFHDGFGLAAYNGAALFLLLLPLLVNLL